MKSIIVGAAGHQGKTYLRHFNYLTELVALVDKDLKSAGSFAKDLGIQHYDTVEKAIAEIDFDLALVCVPHNQYKSIIQTLISHKKVVIKEKPFAISSEEMTEYLDLIEQYQRPIFTMSQRQNNFACNYALNNIDMIGLPTAYHYHYHLAKTLDQDEWRSNHAIAGGGAILDMGYHVISLLLRFFGSPEEISSYHYSVIPKQDCQAIDAFANLQFIHNKDIVGNISFSRHSPEKEESFTIFGTTGSIKIKPNSLLISQHNSPTKLEKTGENLEHLSYLWQIADFINNIENKQFIKQHLKHQVETMRIIFQAYDKCNIRRESHERKN